MVCPQVLDAGFHMLPIGVSDNKERRWLEWRYSFAVAEKLLAKHHLPPVARKAYIYLRLLQVHFFSDPPMIPTYFLQNFFFWLLEKWPLDSWHDDKLADILLLAIDELAEAVKQRDVRHYFIPGVNLLVDLPPTFAGIISAKVCDSLYQFKTPQNLFIQKSFSLMNIDGRLKCLGFTSLFIFLSCF